MINKIKKAINNPSLIIPHLKYKYNMGRLRWIKFSCGEELVIDLDDYKLLVNVNREGIDQELALYGEREPVSSKAYRNELSDLGEQIDNTRVLEVGANIGFWALMPPTEIDDVEVIAVEVDKNNIMALERNISINGFEDDFYIEQVALSDTNGEASVYTHDASNLHSLEEKVYESRKEKVKEVTKTKTIRGDELLSKHKITEEDINVLRMDVEGHEAAILRGLPNIFNHSPLLFHVELHPCYMNEDDIDYIIDRFSGCEIIVAALEEDIFHNPNIEELMNTKRYFEIVGRF